MRLFFLIFIVCIVPPYIGLLQPAFADLKDEDVEPKSTPLDITSIKSKFNSHDSNEAREVAQQIVEDYPKLSQEEQSAIAKIVCAILDQPVEKGEEWNNSCSARNWACWVAGELKIKKAMPYLIGLLRPKPGQILSNIGGRPRPKVDGERIEDAGLALIDMGSAAKEDLEKSSKSSTDAGLKKIIDYILKEIEKNENPPYSKK